MARLIGMRTISIVMLLAAAASGCWSQRPVPRNTPVEHVAPREPPAVVSRAAAYRSTHSIRMVCDDGWCDAAADDTLVIHDARRGGIRVEIELTQTNAHTCSFEGELAPMPQAREGVQVWAFDEEDEEGPCSLTLERSATQVAVRSDGCRYYGGARASLDVTFAETDRLP